MHGLLHTPCAQNAWNLSSVGVIQTSLEPSDDLGFVGSHAQHERDVEDHRDGASDGASGFCQKGFRLWGLL